MRGRVRAFRERVEETDWMNLLLPFDLPRSGAVADAVRTLSDSGSLEARGAVFTKSGIVDAILDLCGYTADFELWRRRFLEPAFGDGEFLLAAVSRLSESFKSSGASMADATHLLSDAIRGVELHRPSFEETSRRMAASLMENGFDSETTERLVSRWLLHDDFLLADIQGSFDFVVGNPPYVRQERIPAPLLKSYRSKYSTLYDRADLYVLFYERGLDLLAVDGALGFICSNRWVKNKYGGPLREKVSNGFHLKYYIDLERADVFHSDVIAYPAITIVTRSPADRTLVALGNRDTATGLDGVIADLTAAAKGSCAPTTSSGIVELAEVPSRRDPWLLDAPGILSVLRKLEHSFPSLEAAGGKVGIGVATGADAVFIGDFDELPVEKGRKLRLAMAADCVGTEVSWGGKGIVNPYLESGQLAPMSDFPSFANYMERNGEVLKKRHTACKQPSKWYKTIDRIYPRLTAEPKLLIPDIKGGATVAHDNGLCYPHHNLYVVTSKNWNLRALQAVLRSSVALMFVAAYSVRMSGGFLRFQAQYLRRIRCPLWSDISEAERTALVEVSTAGDLNAVDSVVFPLFGLTDRDAQAVSAYADEARVKAKGQ